MRESKTTILVVVLFIVLIFIGLTAYFKQRKIDNFIKNGIESTARVTDLVRKQRRNLQTSGSRYRNSYIMEVTFFTQTEKPDSVVNQKIIERADNGSYNFNFNKYKPEIGNFVKTEIEITKQQFSNYNIDDKVQILYLPGDESKAILKTN
jgi:hypothetical protein